VRACGLKAREKCAIERLLARAEVAGDEIALAPAMRKPRILKKAAMDEAGRRGGFADRAAHAGRIEFLLALVAAGPARGAFEPRCQRLGIGEESDLLARHGHLTDRDRLAPIGGDACLQHGLVIADRIHALKPRRRLWREGAIGRLRCADETSASGERDHELANEGGQRRKVPVIEGGFLAKCKARG